MNRLLSIAPMMACTDRHYRVLARLLCPDILLYTEMVTTGAVIYGDRERLLGFSQAEHPVALQLGGNDPNALAESARIAEALGYDEVNLNVGCPSARVQSGQFGACLMKQPDCVAEAVAAMRNVVTIPVTVKTRIGVDQYDDYDFLYHFVAKARAAGCNVFILHARKAWLHGLSPKENREIPPLCYDRVYQLKRDFPELSISINGGIKEAAAIQTHLRQVDGVMIGREAYANPYWLASFNQLFYENDYKIDRQSVLQRYFKYMIVQLARGTPLRAMTRHLIGLFQGQPGAKHWRRSLSETVTNDAQGLQNVKQLIFSNE